MRHLLSVISCFFGLSAWADLTVLTDRPAERFVAAAEKFTADTGVDVMISEAPYSELLQKLENKESADLIITKDLLYLTELDKKKFLAPLVASSSILRVPEFRRGGNQNWVALNYRIRTAAYHPDRVQASELTTYEDLANPKWSGRLCLRNGKGAYNLGLVAYLVKTLGVAKAKDVVKGWLNNLAAPLFANDTALLESMANGLCDVGIVNHYYLAYLLEDKRDFPVKVAFLNQAAGGVYSNGTGMGILSGSAKAELAQKFIEILLEETFQLEISAMNYHYPAVQDLSPTSMIKDWGSPKLDRTPWLSIGKMADEARQIMQELGLD